MKRKLEDNVDVPRKKLKKEIKKLVKSDLTLNRKKVRRKLETCFHLPKKSLEPRKEEINALILKARAKLAATNGTVVKKTANEDGAKKVNGDAAKKVNGDTAKKVNKGTTNGVLPAKAVTSLPQEVTSPDDQTWRTKHNVTVEDSVQLPASLTFAGLDLEDRFRVGFEGFEKPTPIQSASWPYTLLGRDCIGIAETGSGKTLAFIIPALKKLFTNQKGSVNPRCMILAPTRELAMQIEKEISVFHKAVPCRSICIMGGVPKWSQTQAFNNGVDFIVATPGRLLAFLREGAVDLSEVEYVVLDEADRMLEQGFVPDVTELVGACRKKGDRQTMLFSATWPHEVQKLGKSFLHNPVRITVSKSKDDELSAVSTVTQTVTVMQGYEKEDKLWALLDKFKGKKIIVFTLYKKECANLEWSVKDWGFNCVSLHGNKDQKERSRCMQMFRSNKVRMLVATDVASRGLDVRDVEIVINFSMPLTVEDYVHRIGRTGRAGSKGDSYTFFTQKDKLLARGLIELLEKADEEVPPKLFKLRCAKRFKRRY